MRKQLLLLTILSFSTAYSASNIIQAHQLIFYSIVPDTAQEELAKIYPEYTQYLHDTDALLLLHYLYTTDKAVIVKFSADWCGPCKRLKPIVHEAAQDFDNDLVIIEVNIDDQPTLRELFDVDVVPTLIYFKGGQEIERTHDMSKQALLGKIKKLIAEKGN